MELCSAFTKYHYVQEFIHYPIHLLEYNITLWLLNRNKFQLSAKALEELSEHVCYEIQLIMPSLCVFINVGILPLTTTMVNLSIG